MWIFRGLHHELVEAWRAFKQHFGFFPKLLRGIVRFRKIVLGQLFDAFASIDRHKNCGHGGRQGLVGANVGCCLLALDVLLAGGKRENKTAIA